MLAERYKPFTVQFVGDHFCLQTTVEIDLTEPDVADKSPDALLEVAEDLAKNLLLHHYGWDMDVLATIDVEVSEG